MIKKIFWLLEKILWVFRCKYTLWLHGPYGLTKEVERMPLKFMINFLRKYGATIGENCIIDTGLRIHRPDYKIPFKNLIIGNDVYIGHNVTIDLTDKVVIEDNVGISAGCQFWTHIGYFNEKLHDKNDYFEIKAPIVIKTGCVCYANTIVNPGITLEKRSIIYAFSLVNKSVPENEIWAGIPIRFVKRREIYKK